ncbi:MAG: prepilin-type N-terminal cleavage/methylation domain-containing protein [Elusimicrobiaceae bacterium]|nr:prepilin-type N-terminal cleavage/methylation domain-containing protein [Elusimicrobiaceae bacterium]
MNKINNKKGFTLFEVLVVCLIIAIISAIAVPTYQFSVEKSRAAKGVIMLDRIAKAQHTHRARYGAYSESLSGLPLEITDTEGNILKTAEFNDEFFDYKIFGSEFDRARASRNNGEYELSVDYGTSEIMCRPIEHRICQDFGYREGDDFITWPQKTDCDSSIYVYNQYAHFNNSQFYCVRTSYKDGTYKDRVCWKPGKGNECWIFDHNGNKIQHLAVGTNGQGVNNALLVYDYDPLNNKNYELYWYNTDGSFRSYGKYENGQSLISYNSGSTVMSVSDGGGWSNYWMLGFNENGTPRYALRFLNGKQVSQQNYNSDGQISSITYYPVSGVSAMVSYNSDGEIVSSRCYSGDCEGWKAPERSTLGYENGFERPELGNYCEENPDEDLLCNL